MQKRGYLLMATTLLLFHGMETPASEGPRRPATAQIAWNGTPQQAVQIAQKAQRPILAYVTTDRCGYCRKMERATWRDPQVIEQVQKSFVPLRLDAAKHRELVARLKVRSFPTTIVFTPGGEIIGGAAGYLDPAKMAKLMKSSLPSKVAAQPNRTARTRPAAGG